MSNNLNAKEITANTAGNYVQANSGIQQIVGAITEQQAVTLTTADLDYTTGSDQDATSNKYKALRSLYFQFTGTMDADHDVVLPTNKKLYVVDHECDGGFDITFKCSGGTGVAISNGDVALLLCDGTDIFLLDMFSATPPVAYTDEEAQDAVGGILDDGGDIDFTYDDATPKITGAVKSGAITEAKQTLADNTTNNASTSAHGYLVKATAPASGLRNVVAIDNGETVYKNAALFDATNPADIGTAAPGSAMPAARRDHVHALPDGAVTVAKLATAAKTGAIEIVIDGGGAAIATGVKGDVEIPFGLTITQATLLADQSGSIVVDIWKDTYANFPPTVADTITASAKPTLSSAAKSQDATLTGWTTSVSAGDILRFNVDSASTVTRVVLSLKYTKA